MTEYGLSVSALYSEITDIELDSIVKQIKVMFPNSGYRLMSGHLLNQGCRISQAHIIEPMHRVDPDGIAVRWSTIIERSLVATLTVEYGWKSQANQVQLINSSYSIIMKVRDS